MTNFLLALILASAHAAPAVDWNADPLASITSQLVASRDGAAPSAKPVRALENFDYYTLSLEWHPTFCAGGVGRSLPECRPPQTGQYDQALVMHGLWPSLRNDPSNSLGYCGVDSSIKNQDTARTRCQMPPVPLSQQTRDALASKMPGTDNCLERHEWYRHGTCSGLDAETYFALADSLVTQANDGALGRFIAANSGQTVSAADAMNQARADWGSAADSAVHFVCVKGALSEIRITVSPSAQSLSGSLVPGDVGGSCPASFLITAGQ